MTVPSIALSQKTLKLDMKKGIESENGSLKSSSSSKLIRQIKTYGTSDPEESMAKTVISIWYNDENRVVKTETIGRMWALDNKTAYYDVKDQTLTFTAYDIDTQEKQDMVVCKLNSQGYIQEERLLMEEGEFYEDDFPNIYEYDVDGQTLSLSEGEFPQYRYEWVDGNVFISWWKYHSDDRKYTYSSFPNKSNLNLNKLFTQTYKEDVWQFAFLGYIGKKDNNLIENIDDYSTYEYTFDDEGYVSTIKEYEKRKLVNTIVVFYDEIITPNPDPDPTPGNPTTDDELKDLIDNAPEGSEDNPTEIFIPSGDGIVLNKPLDVNKHIRLKGGPLVRGNDNPYAMLRIRSGYSLELDGITIDGNGVSQKDGSLIVYGKLKLKDGVAIKNCNRQEVDAPSGAICVAQGGQLTMDGGEIAGNTGAYGSAVYNEGTFILTDGEISFNNGQIGAVVNNAGGRFIMTGGKISSNKVTEGCGGVFVSEGCSFSMTGGEISNNEDCALYTWSDLQVGGQAKVNGLTLLNEGNRLLVNPALQNNWQISYVDTPVAGTIVASGYNGYQLTNTDYQKIVYANNLSRLKLSGNNIVTYLDDTSVDGITGNTFRLAISDNQVQVDGLPAYTSFIIYGIDGKTVSSHTTDGNGQCIFSLDNGLYLLNCKDHTRKFLVK